MVIPTEIKVGTGEYTESTYLIEDISIHKYLNYIYSSTKHIKINKKLTNFREHFIVCPILKKIQKILKLTKNN